MQHKKSYVGYISHEIRTLLNVTYLGLQVLQQESLHSVSQDSMDIIVDSTDACTSAIDILNDLLLYDKIEDGNMQMELERVVIRSFLAKYVGIFRIQVIYVINNSYAVICNIK